MSELNETLFFDPESVWQVINIEGVPYPYAINRVLTPGSDAWHIQRARREAVDHQWATKIRDALLARDEVAMGRLIIEMFDGIAETYKQDNANATD